ncbi:MAG: Gfo/Idh/MocA family protein [Candidatus Hodarchaeota archaeon]
MHSIDRRTFLLSASLALPAKGANDKVNVGVVGVRGRGRNHIELFGERPDCRVAAVCDIDNAQAERAVQLVEKMQGIKPKVYRDLRKMLEDKDLDAVSLATCNHWHALATIWACQAGKDVYVEKPASHNIWEGRRMVEAARKYKRIVQAGMQSRCIRHKQRAMELLRQGAIGKVYMAKGLCYKRRLSIGKKPDGPVPPGVDFDIWLGPAPMRPFNENRFHYNWHWFWDTGNGDIGNQGVHEMDVARWGLNKSTLPTKVHSSGGKFVYDDDQETPNTQLASFEWDDCQLVFEVRGLLTGGESSISYDGRNFIGNLFFGSEGFMSVDQRGFQVYLGENRELVQKMEYAEPRIWDTAPLVANFVQAVKSRKHTDLAADILEGHLSAALCHMANISYRTGRKLIFDPVTETFTDDAEANELVWRKYREPYVVPAVV